MERDALYADYAGIRPKLAGPGEPFRDFLIEEESTNGFPGMCTLVLCFFLPSGLLFFSSAVGLVNLVGIESPGLTSAPAIAEYVAEKLGYQPCYQPDALG